MDHQQLRSIIIKLEARLSDDDRERLHFYLGNDVPRKIRDDASLRGTLRLMDSLFDQDKINEQDFSFLIRAFEQIQCIDAVNLLKEHTREMLSQSVQSLATIMPATLKQLIEDADIDKYSGQRALLYSSNDSVDRVPSKGTKIQSAVEKGGDHWSEATQRQSSRRPSSKLECGLVCMLILCISGLVLLTSYLIYGTTITKLTDQIEQLRKEKTDNDQIIQSLNETIRDQQTNHRSPFAARLQWKQHATTIAGGKGQGSELNQLSHPEGVYIDSEQKLIYVADRENHRVLEWELGASSGRVVAGGMGAGNGTDQLSSPTDVIVDRKSNSLIICDRGNRRVVQWSLENSPEKPLILWNIECFGLRMNGKGDLLVSECHGCVVKRWRRGERAGTVVAGGNGRGSRFDQLNCPSYIFVDHKDAVYVSDSHNHRVMKWVEDAEEGILVAGGQDRGNSSKQLYQPAGVIVSEMGNVYVADWGNNRVMCWSPGSTEGRLVVGGNGNGRGSNQLNSPYSLAFDGENHLYVVDNENQRIQQFDVLKKVLLVL